MPEPAPTPPRRFRFGLRTLFVLVVIVSIPCAWVGYSLNWIRERHEFLHEDGVTNYGLADLSMPAPGCLGWFGERSEGAIVATSAEQIERGMRLFPEASIYAAQDWQDASQQPTINPPRVE